MSELIFTAIKAAAIGLIVVVLFIIVTKKKKN